MSHRPGLVKEGWVFLRHMGCPEEQGRGSVPDKGPPGRTSRGPWAGSVGGGGDEVMEAEAWGAEGVELAFLGPHHVPAEPVTPSTSLPLSLQFSGNPTPCGWRINGQCVETRLSSSASSPLQCRNTSASCPGRRTRSPSSQVGEGSGARRGLGGERWSRGAGSVLELTEILRSRLVSSLLLFR